MATAFRIHEDIENVLDSAQKKDHHQKNAPILPGKNENKFEKQPLRSTFAILKSVNNDNSRNVGAVTAHAQKSVRYKNNNKHLYTLDRFDHLYLSEICLLLVIFFLI